MPDDPYQDENWRAAGLVAGKPRNPDALTVQQYEALARGLTEHIPGIRVEIQVTTQDTEGNWIWVSGIMAGLWSERYRGDVRHRARVVSDWSEVRS